MTIDIVALAERCFESVRQVLDHVAREKRFLGFTEAPSAKEACAFYRDYLHRRLNAPSEPIA
jgi:hypothetical protein